MDSLPQGPRRVGLRTADAPHAGAESLAKMIRVILKGRMWGRFEMKFLLGGAMFEREVNPVLVCGVPFAPQASERVECLLHEGLNGTNGLASMICLFRQ